MYMKDWIWSLQARAWRTDCDSLLQTGDFCAASGLFPKYTEGMHEKDGTVMIVSRGLGNSSFPFRIFNRPELIEVTLRKRENNRRGTCTAEAFLLK